MGILDTVTNLFRRAPAAPPVVTSSEKGISGTANFGGRVVVEPIAELRDQAGFGRTGTYEWGFWENLGAANSAVAAALDFIVSPIADARVDVEPPPPASGVAPDVAEAMTALVRESLTAEVLGPVNVAAARRALLGGFALYEPVYELRAGRWHLARLAERLPASLAANPWIEDEKGALKAIKQDGYVGNRYVSVELPAEDVLLFIWQRAGNNWTGRSAFRAVQYIAGHVMPTLLKLIGVTLQREGAGIPSVEATDANTPLTDEQRAQLVELLSSAYAHESFNVVMPAGWSLKWVFSAGANKAHVLEVWRELGVVVMQQVGAQQLALGTSNTGARSVGEVHDARAQQKVREVLGMLARVYNGTPGGDAFEGLVSRLCIANFGVQPAYPTLKLTMQQAQLPVVDLAAATKTGVEAGLLTVTADDENTFRDRLGYAPIDEAKRAAGQAQRKAAQEALVPQAQPLAASAKRSAWKPWRPLRAAEAKLKLSDLDEYFTRQRDVFEARARPAVAMMLAFAAPGVSSAMADGKVTPEEIATIPLDTRRLETVITRYLAEVRGQGQAFVREELSSSSTLRAAAEEEDAFTVVQEADEVVDASAVALKRRIESRLRQELEREAIDALRTGTDGDEVVTRVVARQFDTGAFRGDAGAVTTKIFNVGRDEAARLVGGVETVEYTAILDNATCDACRRDDGKTAPFGSAAHDAMLPPNRDCDGADRCRCLLVFIPAEGE